MFQQGSNDPVIVGELTGETNGNDNYRSNYLAHHGNAANLEPDKTKEMFSSGN